MVLLGVGAGLSFPSLTTIAMSGATPSDSGLASGLVNTSLQVGGALGLAVLATLSSSHAKDLLASGSSSSSALAGGLHLALAIGAGLVLTAIAIAATVIAPVAVSQGVASESEAVSADAETAFSEAA
jgi:hypothetical protein